MIPACFARVRQRCIGRLYTHLRLIYPWVRKIRKTRNQLNLSVKEIRVGVGYTLNVRAAQRRMNARFHISLKFITGKGKKNKVVETMTNRVYSLRSGKVFFLADQYWSAT